MQTPITFPIPLLEDMLLMLMKTAIAPQAYKVALSQIPKTQEFKKRDLLLVCMHLIVYKK